MRMIYGNYLTQGGRILVGGLDLSLAEPRKILELRRTTLCYVSQFLWVAQSVSTIDVVAEPLLRAGSGAEAARRRRERKPGSFRLGPAFLNRSGRCRL